MRSVVFVVVAVVSFISWPLLGVEQSTSQKAEADEHLALFEQDGQKFPVVADVEGEYLPVWVSKKRGEAFIADKDTGESVKVYDSKTGADHQLFYVEGKDKYVPLPEGKGSKAAVQLATYRTGEGVKVVPVCFRRWWYPGYFWYPPVCWAPSWYSWWSYPACGSYYVFRWYYYW